MDLNTILIILGVIALIALVAVSYTHLDVYKRQIQNLQVRIQVRL